MLNTETSTWSTLAPLPLAAAGGAGAAVEGKFYVVGGYTGAAAEAARITDRVQIYDPKSNSWSEGSPTPAATAGSGACVVDSKLYVIGGRKTDGALTRRVSIYNTITNRWQDGERLLRGVYDAAAAYDNDCIYLVGGRQALDEETKHGVHSSSSPTTPGATAWTRRCRRRRAPRPSATA